MEAVLKKHFWVVNLLFLAVGAWLLSGPINGVIALKLREIPSLSQTKPSGHSERPRREPTRNYQIVVDRNYFESAMALPVDTVEDGPALDEDGAANLLNGEGVETTLRASLVGTIVADQPAWSMALIVDQTSSETGAYRIKDQLMQEATVVAILTQRVVLEHNGVREYLELQEKAAPKSRLPQRPMHGHHPKSASSSVGEGIKRTGDTEWTIERGEIEKTLSNLNSIAMQARIVPSFKNGESNGFKLFAIRPGSLYSKIGIQNGDIIHKINGFPINSPDKALEVYQKLKSARSIVVELTRRGQTKSLKYRVQ